MSDFDSELPSIQKLKQDIKGGKKLISLLTLGGRFSILKRLDKNMYHEIKSLENQVNELIVDCEEFNSNFAEYGWIAYESLDTNIIKQTNAIFKNNGISQAEEYLVSFYSGKIEDYFVYLKRNQEFSIRYDLIVTAFEDHKNGRYNQCIPIYLMMIDGAVSDYSNTGFAAKKTEVDAWDSLAGHSQGLKKLKEIYTKNRTKTNLEFINLPYRNGILHGRDLNYGNSYVSCKALAMIFAVNDWLTAKKTEDNRKEKFIESTKVPSWKELAESINKTAIEKELIKKWAPRNINIGESIPTTGLPDKFEDNTPEKAVAIFINFWSKNNYGQMAMGLDSRFFYEKSEKKKAGLCRQLFSNKTFDSYEFISVIDKSAAITEIKLIVKWLTNQKKYDANITFGAVYCDDNDRPLVRGQEGGKWILNAWDIRELYVY